MKIHEYQGKEILKRYGDDGSALLCNNNCRMNDYDEDSLQARVQYRPSEDSSLVSNLIDPLHEVPMV